MERDLFLKKLDELFYLAPGTLKGNEKLADQEFWDSMALVTVISLVDEEFGVIIPAERLRGCKTADDLYAVASTGAARA